MKQLWSARVVLCVAACAAPTIHAACTDTALSPARSDAALRALTEMGAEIHYRDEVGGEGKIMLTTDGNWRGGDEGLAHLKHVVGLYKLRLAGHISDTGMLQLSRLCGVTSLDLHIVAITDVGVRQLRTLTRLQRLNLTYTKVTDTGLESLSELTKLKWLGLSYTRVTRAGIDKLKRSLGDTIIEGNPSR